jgi:hypothetical protein
MATYQDKSGNNIIVGNPELNPQLTAGRTLVSQNNDPSAPPVGDTIDASALGGNSLSFPETPIAQNYGSILSGLPDTSSLGQMTSATQEVTPAEKTQKTVSDRLLQAYQKLTGKSQVQQEAEQTAGLPEYQKQLTDVSSQIQALQKEASAIPLQVQQDFTGRGATVGGVAPIQTAMLRNNAIKSLGLSSIAQTLQGNIALAQQQADRAVETEFAPVQAEIDYLSKAYEMNKDVLTREDKKKADALQIQLTERQRLLDNQKEDKKIVLGWAAEAAKNGAPALLLSRASEMGDPNQALALLSPYFTDPEAKANALADRAYKNAQTAQLNRETELMGEPTPADKAKEASLLQTKQGQDLVLGDKINLIDSILSSGGMNARVGTSFATRKSSPSALDYLKGAGAGAVAGAGAGFLAGGVGAIPGAIGGAILGYFWGWTTVCWSSSQTSK